MYCIPDIADYGTLTDAFAILVLKSRRTSFSDYTKFFSIRI